MGCTVSSSRDRPALLAAPHEHGAVAEAQRHVQPRVVVVELCKRRKAMLQLPLDGQIAKAELTMVQ